MDQEVKIRIVDAKRIEDMLVAKGATFIEEKHIKDTYFKQPDGEVLKIVEKKGDAELARLQRHGGRFVFIYRKPVENATTMKKDLESTYGIKAIQEKVYRLFSFHGYTLNVNVIKDVGSFLIISANRKIEDSFILDVLGIENPEYITVPFSDL